MLLRSRVVWMLAVALIMPATTLWGQAPAGHAPQRLDPVHVHRDDSVRPVGHCGVSCGCDQVTVSCGHCNCCRTCCCCTFPLLRAVGRGIDRVLSAVFSCKACCDPCGPYWASSSGASGCTSCGGGCATGCDSHAGPVHGGDFLPHGEVVHPHFVPGPTPEQIPPPHPLGNPFQDDPVTPAPATPAPATPGPDTQARGAHRFCPKCQAAARTRAAHYAARSAAYQRAARDSARESAQQRAVQAAQAAREAAQQARPRSLNPRQLQARPLNSKSEAAATGVRRASYQAPSNQTPSKTSSKNYRY